MRSIAAALLLLTSTATAQTLFTYGGNPVSKQEFLRVYTKNSLTQKPDYSDKALREYLDLYSLFRMKVREAQLMRLDTVPSIGRELDNYRRQLAKTYLTDEKVTNTLIREAYDRMREEVRVSHILVMASPGAVPADSAAKFRLIDSLYRQVSTGKADFAAVAKQYSEDQGSNKAGGDIGYMTGLQTVYPFENAVYATPVGKISKPFRTQFGYHIVKVVDRRPARGEVQVAQIMAGAPESKGAEGMAAARRKLDSVRAALRGGMSFSDAARKYSDDKFTAEQGGVMDAFTVGRTTPGFEAAAFGLKKQGDVSEPVQTEYGLHLIQLIRRTPLKPYDSVASSLKRRVEADSRAQTAREAYFERVKAQHGFSQNAAALTALTAEATTRISDTGAAANMFRAQDFAGLRTPLFTIGGQGYTGADFMAYTEELTRGRLQGPKDPLLRDVYKMYVTKVVNDFQEASLEKENPDFKALMGEYRDGILLFELMDRNVWSKASRDTTGLQTFWNARANKYTWEPGFRGVVYRFKNETALNSATALLQKSDTKEEDVVRALNSETTPDAVTVQRGRYEWSRFSDVPRTAVSAKGMGQAQKGADGTYTLVVTDETFAGASPKTLADARGYVVAEYQDHLEKEWNASLRQKYPVKVEEPVFRSMVK